MYAYSSGDGDSPVEAVPNGRFIDLRSDTVTRPSREMREAMAKAAVGDDVYGEDPSVNALERRAAELLGKEAAVFFPSATQSNLSAVLAHCGRGSEYICGDSYHIFSAEAGGPAVLGGLTPFAIPTAADGSVSAADVQAAIKPDDPHCPISRLLCLENTVSGSALTEEQLIAPAEAAKAQGLAVHLDGARLFNAAVALAVDAARLASVADTVSICLSKGLGAPAGALLCGPGALMKSLRRWRKMLGGGMRQAGLLAACGSFALEHNIARLADDHRRARRLAESLAGLSRLRIDPNLTRTNMLFLEVSREDAAPLRNFLHERGILISAAAPLTRLVFHLDITDEDVERTAAAFAAYDSA